MSVCEHTHTHHAENVTDSSTLTNYEHASIKSATKKSFVPSLSLSFANISSQIFIMKTKQKLLINTHTDIYK